MSKSKHGNSCEICGEKGFWSALLQKLLCDKHRAKLIFALLFGGGGIALFFIYVL